MMSHLHATKSHCGVEPKGAQEASFSQALQFFQEICFLHAAQFAYRKGLCCTDALLIISDYLQNSIDAGMEYYIVQLDLSAAFDRVSHSGHLSNSKFIGVGGSVL